MKRTRARFGQVISGYVDPTPDGLNVAYERHMDNLLMMESNRQNAAMLKSAPFEGDKALRRQLLQNTDAALQAIAGQASHGNLSNFTGAVTRAASEFTKGAQPISTNHKAYVDYQSNIKDLLDKGKIDAEDAQGNMMLSQMGYNGLEYGEDGELTNYFQGKHVWQKPEMQEMINKALSQISPDGYREVRTILEAGPDGSLTVDTDQGIKTISRDKVDAALNGVLGSQEVLGYYQRKGEIRVAGIEDDADVVEYLNDVSDSYASQVDESGNVTAESQRHIADIQKALQTSDPQTIRSEAVKQMRDQQVDVWRQSAINAKSFVDKTDSVKTKYNAKAMARYKQSLSDASQGLGLLTITESGINFNRPGGDNAGELYKSIQGASDRAANLQQQWNEQSENMSDSQRMALQSEMRGARMEERMLTRTYEQLYGRHIENLEFDEEFQKRKSDLLDYQMERANRAWWNPAGWFENWMTDGQGDTEEYRERELQQLVVDYLADQNLDHPQGPSQAIPVEYVDPTVLGAPAGTNAAVKAYFGGGVYRDDMMVIDPQTGEAVTMEELSSANKVPENAQFVNMSVSSTSPIGAGMTMRIGWKSKDGDNIKSGSVIVPINQGTGLSLDGLDEYLNSSHTRLLAEMNTYKAAGLKDSGLVPFFGKNGNDGSFMKGFMSFNFETDTVTIFTPDRQEITKVPYRSGREFIDHLKHHNIELL